MSPFRRGASLPALLLTAVAVATPAAAAEEAPLPAQPQAEPSTGRASFCLQAVGDLNLAGSAAPVVTQRGFDWAFEGTRALLGECPLNIANLETPVTDRGRPAKKTFVYRMPPASLEAVRRAGFGLVSLANNHTLDQGAEGLSDTLAALKARGIAHAGAGPDVRAAREPAVVVVDGVRVGFLSYSLTFPQEFWATDKRAGTAFGHEAWVRRDVAALRERVDVLLVAFHWGEEKRETPKPYQRDLARAAVESGADAVIGHHPHVLQGVELVDGRPILHSLGNYAFGSRSQAARDSAIARLLVVDGRLAGLELIPIDVENRVVEFNPRVAEGETRERILATLSRLSSDLGTVTEVRDGRLVVQLGPGVAAK